MSDVFVVSCVYCGGDLDPQERTTYRRVVGWERKAVSSSRKSGSDITLREPRDEYACPLCVGRLQSGLSASQGSLL